MDKKCKIVIFALVLLVAVILLGVLVAHRSEANKIKCADPQELYFTEEEGGNGTCILASASPCQGELVLVPSPMDKYVGVCDCDSESSNRTVVYHAETKSCHFIFKQAYCAPGEWLTIDKATKQAKCVVNSCRNITSTDGSEIVPLNSTRCAELGKYDKETCTSSGQVIQFFKNKLYPSCIAKNRVTISGVGNNKPPPCPSGTFNSPLGGCQPDFDFD